VKNNKEMIDSLKKIKNIGYKVKNFLEKGDFENFAQIMNDHWHEKKKRSKIMSNPKINFWYD
jgi:D-glycero-alpha-D-manno-heptose-7-phosphate kinase